MRMRKLLVPIVGGLLAAVAVAGSASASAATGEEPPKPPDVDRQAIVEARGEWADCLREQGVDIPEDGPFVVDHSDEELRAALEACHEKLGDVGGRHFPPFPAERMEELRGKLDEFHDCLREQGVDVPELPAPPEVFDDEGVPHRQLYEHPFHDLDDAELKGLREAAEACGAELPHDAMPFFHHAA